MPNPNAPTQILLAPAGSGKTQVALQRLVETTLRQPFGRAWVLLPTERQSHAFRQRLLNFDPTRHAFFNVDFFNFYTLYAQLLDAAGKPHRCLDEAARLRLLRRLAMQRQDDGLLRVFGGIAHTPGFVRVLANFIYELKSNLIQPDAYSAAALTDKDRDLAELYADYQASLQRYQLVDREGEGWLALDALHGEPDLGTNLELLVVDGFDQFSPLQARLLALLGGRAKETIITLTTVPGLEDGVGRRFTRALDRLLAMHDEEAIPVDVLELDATPAEDRHPALTHLTESLYRSPVIVRPPSPGVQMLEAPEPVAEVAAVLRRTKRLLLDGVAPNDILIAIRDWSLYGHHFRSQAQSYGLAPLLSIQNGEPLRENPAIAALFDLLDLHAGDFRRRDVIDVLSSSYFKLPGLGDGAAAQLDRLSRIMLVGNGRGAWSDAIRAGTTYPLDPDDEASPRLLTPDEAHALERSLLQFFERVTPPASASLRSYVNWLELLIGNDPEQNPDEPEPMAAPDVWSVELIERARRPARLPGVVERDLLALARLKDVLRALVSSQTLLASLGAGDAMTWADFMTELRSAVTATVVRGAPGREGRVLVTSVADARGLPHRHVFILGLAEGVFPARLPEDPLYLDTERARLTAHGIPLETAAERADDDSLFYELMSQATQQLVLSRPYIKNGAPWPESHLWRAVMRLFVAGQVVERLPIAGVVAPSEVASLSEAALAAAERLNTLAQAGEAAALLAWLDDDDERADYWKRIRAGRQIEWRRMSGHHAHDRYSGRLSQPDVIASAAASLGEKKVWSASQLNEFGTCAFRFFAGRMLGLETLREPEDGMTFVHVGTINHDILEHTYKQVSALGWPVAPDYTEDALQLLRHIARDRLREAPEMFGFQPSALWEQEKDIIQRKLEAFVRHDFADNPLQKYAEGARYVHMIESAFGEDLTMELDLGEDLGTLRVRGKIDRIDRVGDSAVIIDYKTGGTQISRAELERGRNFQMMLYMLAAQRLMGDDPTIAGGIRAGVFWHIGGRKIVGALELDDAGQEALDAGYAHLARYLGLARSGDFASEATALEDRKCVRYCEFSTMCRVSIMSRRKPQT
jgi:ATP-dependent helicase/nuclease subunit B